MADGSSSWRTTAVRQQAASWQTTVALWEVDLSAVGFLAVGILVDDAEGQQLALVNIKLFDGKIFFSQGTATAEALGGRRGIAAVGFLADDGRFTAECGGQKVAAISGRQLVSRLTMAVLADSGVSADGHI